MDMSNYRGCGCNNVSKLCGCNTQKLSCTAPSEVQYYQSNALNDMLNSKKCCMCKCKCCPPHDKIPVCPKDPQYANAYVPFQYIKEIYEPMKGLCSGTIFPELVSPYVKNQSQYEIMYLQQTKTCGEER